MVDDAAGGGLGGGFDRACVFRLLSAGHASVADEPAIGRAECRDAADDPLSSKRAFLAEFQEAIAERRANSKGAFDTIVDTFIDIGCGY
jgi:hypothetical protein